MIGTRGFSLLEVMLALIVVGIGISVVLSFSSSNQQQTGTQAIGNNYSVVTNDILYQFLENITTCNTNNNSAPNANTTCPTQTFSEKNAYDYLCENTVITTSASINNAVCTNNKITSTQYTNLKNAGIDLLQITLTLETSSSDTSSA